VRTRHKVGLQGTLRWATLLVPLLLLVLLPALWWSYRAGDGALRDSTGHALNVLGGPRASSLPLSDGSRIELGENSELQVLDNDSTTFACALRRGRGTFEVKPGGGRRWRVEAGKIQVEVVGTRFVVERRAGETVVRVLRGTVLVRGESVPDGVQKLGAGDELNVSNGALAASGAAAPAPAASVVAAAQQPAVSAGLGSEASSEPHATAVDPLASAARKNSLQVADEQRRHGDISGAIQTLRAVAGQAQGGSERSIAAFTLGKLLLDATGQPAEAARAFRACLKLSPPASVAEAALARLVEAEARLGNSSAARALALDYERRYPSGRRLMDVQRWGRLR
jgi:transmembrane sensor